MSEKVKVTVIKGSIGNDELGGFEKGAVFETTRDKISNIDSSFIQVEDICECPIIEEPIVEAKPLAKTTKKVKAVTE